MKIETKQFAILCDAGKRTHNEDFVYPTCEQTDIISVQDLYIVCDGIGGANKGDVAARLAASNFATYFSKFPPVLPIAQPYLDGALKFVEGAMDDYIKQHPECWGMGTTIALLYLDNHGANIAWAGNSRVYHFRKNQRKFRTEDHTEVNQLIKEGKITEQEAQTHSRRHSILRAIQGGEYPTQLDAHHIPWSEIQAGDYFFLCTDGILEATKEDELATLFGTGEGADKLNIELEHLCQIGSNDNFGAVIVQLVGDAVSPNTAVLTPVETPTFDAEVETPHTETPVEEGVVAETPTANVVPLEIESNNLMSEIPAEFQSDAPIVDANAEHNEHNAETPEVAETPVAPEVVAEVSENTEEVVEEVVAEEVVAEVETPEIVAPIIETPIITPPVVETPKPKLENPFSGTTSKPTEKPISNAGANPQVAGNDLPEPGGTSNSARVAILLTLATIVILGFVYFLWQHNNSASTGGASFEGYMSDAKKLYEERNFETAIAKSDSAYKLAEKSGNKDQIKDALDLYNNIKTAKSKVDIETYMAEAAEYEKSGKYIDLFKARTQYQGVIDQYGDTDSMATKNVSRLDTKMKEMNHDVAFGELMDEAKKLCAAGQGADANAFVMEAEKLDASLGKHKDIVEFRKNCKTSTETRDIANGGTETKGGATPTDNPKPTPHTNVIKGGKNSSNEVVASRDLPSTNPNARVSTNPNARVTVTTPASNTLSEGKRLYEKAKAQKSKYVYGEAAKNLEKAARSKPASAEAAYLLAVIYNEGLTGAKDAKKALDFAKQSADMNYPQGAKYYGTMLQKLGDAKNAAIYLNKAKAAGVK